MAPTRFDSLRLASISRRLQLVRPALGTLTAPIVSLYKGYETNVLNYNIRVLGREGVLVLNFIADIENLAEVKAAAPDVLAMPSFTPGNTYAEFNPSTDAVAAYGIGGLIAGKAAAKTGLLAAGVLLLKKFWFVLLIPLIGLKNVIFGRRA